ncbi:hypothetical protein WICPIJ_005818 [Wickerhamomyces pijperi]|uniref:Uncharacterized protein n=1 Tax=Wickerhamomyces pijperi TaxID=599730 RepID=A0A9P8Q4X4_WICPI|nr:hypothetical protein WICPIJ_005818 [Wickerhamomyces pijperi]
MSKSINDENSGSEPFSKYSLMIVIKPNSKKVFLNGENSKIKLANTASVREITSFSLLVFFLRRSRNSVDESSESTSMSSESEHFSSASTLTASKEQDGLTKSINTEGILRSTKYLLNVTMDLDRDFNNCKALMASSWSNSLILSSGLLLFFFSCFAFKTM